MNKEKTYDLIAIGESLIDFISVEITDHVGNANRYQLYLGGQVTNLAANVANLGKQVALAACLGKDGLSKFIFDELELKNVNTDFIQYCPSAPTTVSIITRSKRTPDFLILRGADSYLEPSQGLFDAISNCKVLHTSAFALSKDPTRSTILQLLAEANQQGKIITLDPNYHLEIWPDTPDFIDILKEAFQYTTITKPSIEDCHRLFGAGKHPLEYSKIFKKWGAKIVIITQGKEGVFLSAEDDTCYQITPNQIEVADVTGAGDAFWSGVITGILNDLPILKAILAGQVIAEIKLKQLGPITSMPEWNQIVELSKTIKYRTC